MGTSLGELFLGGGWVMWPLLVFSVITWAIVLERAYVYLRLRPRLQNLTQSLVSSLRSGDTAAAKQICHQENPQIGELFLSTLDTKRSREQAERVTDRNRVRFMNYLKRNLWILGTIGSASPFVGLLGTVVGIVRAFHSMAEKGTGGFSVVAAGISEALIATAAGLVVAIIALLTYNIFVTFANLTMSQVRLTLDEILDHSFEKAAS
ncbi:MAG: MotA/TolQ/ExbB proton channel family protein [Bdellovibrionales bacterium]|nr:MotA/TolQ/ExbB proton channel family protein [Bdellovibrionales bacterium]